MPVTIKEIAREAGVSIAAVSKALNNRSGISVVLKRRIEKIAETRGYAPYIKSRQTGMYAGSSRYIAILFPFADEHLSREVQRGIDAALTDSGFFQIRYHLSDPIQIIDETRKEIFISKILQDPSIVGLAAVFFKMADATVAHLKKKGVATMQLNHHSNYGQCVTIDNFAAARQATKIFIRLGRRKIGLIMPEEMNEAVWQDRLNGYKKALSEAHLPYEPYYIAYEHSFSLKESALATKFLIEREPAMDAILYGSDLQAYGGIEALKALNKKIPDDVAVIGFDNLPFSKITDPPLTSIDQPMFEMGKLGMRMMLDAIRKKKFVNKAVTLKSRLILRQSSHKNILPEKFF